jgi:hypothetical protein
MDHRDASPPGSVLPHLHPQARCDVEEGHGYDVSHMRLTNDVSWRLT